MTKIGRLGSAKGMTELAAVQHALGEDVASGIERIAVEAVEAVAAGSLAPNEVSAGLECVLS